VTPCVKEHSIFLQFSEVCHPDLRVEGEGCVPMVEYFAKVDIHC
jgi:hypothetical protein